MNGAFVVVSPGALWRSICAEVTKGLLCAAELALDPLKSNASARD